MPERPRGTISIDRFLKVLRDAGYTFKTEARHRNIWAKGTERRLIRKTKWLVEGEIIELLKSLDWTQEQAEVKRSIDNRHRKTADFAHSVSGQMTRRERLWPRFGGFGDT
jgi:hypothetical protein